MTHSFFAFTFCEFSPSAIHSSLSVCLHSVATHGLHSCVSSHQLFSVFWRPPRHNFLFYSYSFPDYRGRCCCRLCSFLLRSVLFEREKRCSCFFPSINPRNLGIWLDNWGHWCGNGANQQSSSINNAAQTQGCAGLERRLEGSLVAQIRAHAFVSVVEYLPSVSWSTVDASVCKDIICQTLTPSLPVCLTLCLPPPPLALLLSSPLRFRGKWLIHADSS